jgi:hypothetical protein
MTKRLALLIILLGFTFSIFAQLPDEGYYQLPDRETLLSADGTGDGTQYKGDPVSLVKTLTEHFEDPLLKYKAIYSWITHHIDYDFEALEDRSKLEYLPLDVLDSMKTICGGYALLMCYLCNLAGLECEYIVGWSKLTTENLKGINWSFADHAWNAIRIKGVWRYCDTTWGSGYGKEIRIGHGEKAYKKEIFVHHYTSAYFDMPAEKAFLQHYPEETRWQNEYSMTKEEFDAQPLFDRSYFTTWTYGFFFQKKNLKTRFLCSEWLHFKSKTSVHSLYACGGQISLPFLRIGKNYLCCISPGKKDKPVNILVNNEVLLTYLNK